VVVAFGQILVREVLEAPRLGCFNLHASLLPRWRGAAPIQRAIMAGDAVTGVQVMRMSEGLDEGPVLMGEQVRIDALETAGTLHDKLAAVGARMLPVALGAIERGAARETPQSEDGVTYARKIKAAEARIDWTRPAAEVDRHIRGLSPFPGAWFEAPSEKGPVRVKALLSRVEDGEGPPGTTLDDALLIACGDGAVRLLKAQREGKGAQDAEVFVRGFPLAAGTVLA
jgi:methionyl-tRNA formyltransferase